MKDYWQQLNVCCPSVMKGMTIADVIKEIDEFNDLLKHSKGSANARQASITSGDYAKRFDQFSKDNHPSEYTYAIKEHACWCSQCVI